MRCFLLAFIGLSLLNSAVLRAEETVVTGYSVQPSVTYQYYTVRPEAGISIYRQMFKDSTITHKDVKVAAITDWDIKYNCDYKKLDDNLCEIEKFEVTCRCDLTLPRLVTKEIRLQEAFDEYMIYLKRHELQHCQIATDYANHLEKNLRALAFRPMECGALKSAVKASRNEAVTEAKKEHRLFDRRTLENRKKFHAGEYFLGDLFPDLASESGSM